VVTRVVRGVVINERAGPINEATVRIVLTDGALTTKTGADGRFVFTEVHGPVLGMSFTADGYGDARLDGRELKGGPPFLVQRLLRKRTGLGHVAGVVVDENGAPIREFKVLSFVEDGKWLDTTLPSHERAEAMKRRHESYRKIDVDDEHGTFTFELPTGHRSIGVIADGFRRDREAHVVDVMETEVASVRVVLEHSNELRGVVTDTVTHQPIKDAAVYVQNAIGSFADTDDLGRFAVRSLPRMRYTVLVDAPGYFGLYVGGFHGDSDRNETLNVELNPDPGPRRKPGSLKVGPREHVGVGINVAEDPRGLLVSAVAPDGPAIGVLTKGDIIVEVDGEKLPGRNQYESTSIVGGAEGTEAHITVLREGKRVDVEPIVRKRLGPYGGEPTLKPGVFLSLSFDDALALAKKQEKVLLVDATADWCAPCQRMDETTWIDPGVTAALSEKAVAIQIDVEAESELAKHLGISSMPTIIAFRDGKELDRVVGSQNPTQLLEWFDGLGRAETSAHRATGMQTH
jgi:thiol-disulfide isomerase/thioredoxin